MNKPKRQRFNQSILILVIFSILAVLGLAYSINNSYAPDAGAEIRIFSVSNDARFFLDSKKRSPNLRTSQYAVIENVSPGTHTLIVHMDGRLPWAKNLQFIEGVTLEVAPFNLPQTPMLEVIPEYVFDESGRISNDAYEQIESLFGTQPASELSYNGNVSISYAGNEIRATWQGSEEFIPYFFCIYSRCDVSFSVLDAQDPVRAAQFFPMRDNVVIFSTGNSINAIELDRTGTQNFQPIYTGIEPSFALDSENPDVVYIRDGESLMRLAL